MTFPESIGEAHNEDLIQGDTPDKNTAKNGGGCNAHGSPVPIPLGPLALVAGTVVLLMLIAGMRSLSLLGVAPSNHVVSENSSGCPEGSDEEG